MIDTSYYIPGPRCCFASKVKYADLETTEGVGFGPTVPRACLDTPVYQTGAINLSANLPPCIAVGAQKRSAATAMQFRTASQTTKALCFSGRRARNQVVTADRCLRSISRSARYPYCAIQQCLTVSETQPTAKDFRAENQPAKVGLSDLYGLYRMAA